MFNQLLKKLEGAYSDNTIKAYSADLSVFENWCQLNNLTSLPADAMTICEFITYDMISSSAATIRRRMASIRRIHKLARFDDPTKDEDVALALRRMHRKKGRLQRQAFALTHDVLEKLMMVTDDSTKGYRDRALLLLAHNSMRRRSEICTCQWSDIGINADGTGMWLLPFSKSDQEGFGKKIPLSSETIIALRKWKERASITEGYVMRGFVKKKQVGASLDPSHISRIFKKLAIKAKLSDVAKRTISGHSARIGRAHDLLNAGQSLPQIMVAGGWKSTGVVMRYLENCDLNHSEQFDCSPFIN